jgi:hypothetical protein
MRTANFAQDLLSVQTELLNFAYKLTADCIFRRIPVQHFR